MPERLKRPESTLDPISAQDPKLPPEEHVRELVSQTPFSPLEQRVVDLLLTQYQEGYPRNPLAKAVFEDDSDFSTTRPKRLGVQLDYIKKKLEPKGVTVTGIRKDWNGPTKYVFRRFEPLDLTTKPRTASTKTGESAEFEIQELPLQIQPEAPSGLTPSRIIEALHGIEFPLTQQRVVDALIESFDGLEATPLARIASPAYKMMPESLRSNLRYTIDKINRRTEDFGLIIKAGNKNAATPRKATTEFYYRWGEVLPEAPRPTEEPEELLDVDDLSEEESVPIYIPSHTEIIVSPEGQMVADIIGRDIARKVTSEILHEKEPAERGPLSNVPADILEVSTALPQSEIDSAFAGLTPEERRQVLVKSTIEAIDRAWTMFETRQTDSKEDLATVFNCHGLARKGIFIGELIQRITDDFQAEVPPSRTL